MKPGLSLQVSQHLALTPQLQQSIRLLQLSTLELAQEVEQMLDDNPFLERAFDDEMPAAADGPAEASTASAKSLATDASAEHETNDSIAADVDPVSVEGQKDLDFSSADSRPDLGGEDEGQYADSVAQDDSAWGADSPVRIPRSEEGDAPSALEMTAAHLSLADFLHHQALSLRLSELDQHVLHFLIGNLNDDGYLEDSLPALALGLAGPEDAEQLEELEHRLTLGLRLLQSLEPTGVGARDLAECLCLQLRSMQAQGDDSALTAVALQLCAQPLEMLARRDVRKLMQRCDVPEAQVRAALAVIARLEPKPGRRFADVERHVIVPDVLVTVLPRRGAQSLPQFNVQLNPDVLPRLRVQEVYAQALRGHKQAQGHAGLQQRLQEARWFIKNVQQRFDTILRISQAIVERQKNFFVHGEMAMQPLVLRDIAQALGLHESTISRVTTAKYMATPQGTYELKFFFGSGLGTETGGNASSTAVRALIKQLVAAENTAKPLSDSQIAEMLKEQGIACARRTVAKYREALKIAPANLRKAL